MPDRLTAGLDALDRVPVPVTWHDVHARLDPLTERDHRSRTVGPARRPPTRWLVAAAAVLVVVGVANALIRDDPRELADVDAGPESTQTTSPDAASTDPTSPSDPTAPSEPSTVTTQAAVGTSWRFGVRVWTGREYLVWSGEAGVNDSPRADGWRFDPATDTVRDIPVAPVAPRSDAAGVWTGEELVVCCGRSPGPPAEATTSAASAAAFDPDTERWRTLAAPPREAGNSTFGTAWTGTHLLVLVQLPNPGPEPFGNGGPALFAYDLAADRWARRADPPFGDRFTDAVWTGRQLAIWTADSQGALYDPAADRWQLLDPVPGPAIRLGSIGWTGTWLVVFGSDATDDTRSVGYTIDMVSEPSTPPTWVRMTDLDAPPIEYNDGTPGSQTLISDPANDQVLVYPVHGSERWFEWTDEIPILSFHPWRNRWNGSGMRATGHAPELSLGGGRLLQPDRADPSLARVPG